jgi:hypothetical protein
VPLQITSTGVTPPAADETAALARTFDACHVVRLAALLHPSLLRRVQARLGATDAWKTNVHDLEHGESTELLFSDDTTLGLLTALFHDPGLFAAIRGITGCDPIRSYHGRIYRMDASKHTDVWHTDVNGKYLVALSLNLTSEPFAGGELHLRDVASKRVYAQVANTGPGDAVLFRLDTALEHIVTPVTGPVPKVAWAGWFHRDSLLPDLDRLAGL